MLTHGLPPTPLRKLSLPPPLIKRAPLTHAGSPASPQVTCVLKFASAERGYFGVCVWRRESFQSPPFLPRLSEEEDQSKINWQSTGGGKVFLGGGIGCPPPPPRRKKGAKELFCPSESRPSPRCPFLTYPRANIHVSECCKTIF